MSYISDPEYQAYVSNYGRRRLGYNRTPRAARPGRGWSSLLYPFANDFFSFGYGGLQSKYHYPGPMIREPYVGEENNPRFVAKQTGKAAFDAFFGYAPLYRPTNIGDLRFRGDLKYRPGRSFWNNVRDRTIWRLRPTEPGLELPRDITRRLNTTSNQCIEYEYVQGLRKGLSPARALKSAIYRCAHDQPLQNNRNVRHHRSRNYNIHWRRYT